MNYGKLAYLRLDEIENAISSFETSLTKNYSANYTPNTIISTNNSYSIAEISGDGVINIVVTFDVDTIASGSIELYLDDLLIGSCVAQSISRNQYIIMDTLELEGGGILKVKGDESYQADLYCISLMVHGEGAYIKRSDIDVALVESATYCGSCYSDGTNVYLQKYDVSTALADDAIQICFGTTFDMDCDDSDNFFIASIDRYDVFSLYVVDSDDNVSQTILPYEADSAAIAYCSGTAVIAYVSSGVCKYVEVDVATKTISNEMDLDVSVTASDVHFVKNREYPMMIINSDDKLLMITSEPEFTLSETVSVVINASLEVED